MIKRIISITVIGFALCASSVAPSISGDFAPSITNYGASGCYAVSGEMNTIGNPNLFVGTLSGDLQGNVITEPGPVVLHGIVYFRPMEMTMEITGGIVEPLVGHTLKLESDFLGIVPWWPLMIASNTSRITEGAQKANLTFHGWTDMSNFPTMTHHSDFHGVICP